MTHEFNCLFLFGEPAYVNYALLCLRKNKSQKYFSAQTQTLWQNANTRSPPPTTTTANPHLSAPLLAHWRKLNICLFSPSLPQNLASLSNFSFFSFFPGQVWDSLATGKFNLQPFFFWGSPVRLCLLVHETWGTENRYRTGFDRP